MDELLEALTDPDFCWFIDDYSFATEMVLISARMDPRPLFMPMLIKTMKMNSD